MKLKKMVALAALILALCGCGTASAAGGQSVQVGFSMEYATFCAMTPRYNADGTLYQGGVAHE